MAAESHSVAPPIPPGQGAQGLPVRAAGSHRRRALAAGTVALLALGAVVFIVLTSGGQAWSTIRARGFTSAYPASWTRSLAHPGPGASVWSLSSTGQSLDGLGIPPAGTIGITVGELPLSALVDDLAAAGQPAAEILPYLIGIPRGTEQPTVTMPLHALSLAGASAAEVAYRYIHEQVRNVQEDIVARRGGDIAWLELDSEPALAVRGMAVLRGIIRRWRWR